MNEINPIYAIAAYLLAIVTAALVLRAVPKISDHLEHAGNSRFASIDGLRGYPRSACLSTIQSLPGYS
jgi:hypothetical protein